MHKLEKLILESYAELLNEALSYAFSEYDFIIKDDAYKAEVEAKIKKELKKVQSEPLEIPEKDLQAIIKNAENYFSKEARKGEKANRNPRKIKSTEFAQFAADYYTEEYYPDKYGKDYPDKRGDMKAIQTGYTPAQAERFRRSDVVPFLIDYGVKGNDGKTIGLYNMPDDYYTMDAEEFNKKYEVYKRREIKRRNDRLKDPDFPTEKLQDKPGGPLKLQKDFYEMRVWEFDKIYGKGGEIEDEDFNIEDYSRLGFLNEDDESFDLEKEFEDNPRLTKFKDLPADMQKKFSKEIKVFGKNAPGDPNRDYVDADYETYYFTTSYNKETGSVGHRLVKLPSYAKLYNSFSKIINDIKTLMRVDAVKSDNEAKKIFEDIKTLFRQLQRYLRTNHPKQYDLMKMRRMAEGIKKAKTLLETNFNLDEKMDINDPVMIKLRQAKMRANDMKKLDALKKTNVGFNVGPSKKERKAREIVRKLKIKRAQVMSDMENDPDIEPTGGPVADMYGDQLNKIDNAIEKAASVYNKPMDYDTAVGKINEEKVTFGYDLDAIQDVVDYLEKNYEEGSDYELHTQRGDDLPNTLRILNPRLQRNTILNDLLNYAQSDQDRYDAYTDYEERRREEDDYYEDPDYYKEDKGQKISKSNMDGYKKGNLKENLLDKVNEQEPEEKPDLTAPKETVLEDATDQMLSKFPTLKAAIIKLQTEDFKEFVSTIDWISPRPTTFRVNLKNGQDYILKWTGKTFQAQIMGKRYFIDKINDYQQALDKLNILYKEGPMSGAGEDDPADPIDTSAGGGGGGDFPGDDAAGGGGEEAPAADVAGGEEEGGADLTGEPVDFEEPAEEPEA